MLSKSLNLEPKSAGAVAHGNKDFSSMSLYIYIPNNPLVPEPVRCNDKQDTLLACLVSISLLRLIRKLFDAEQSSPVQCHEDDQL